MVSNIKQMARQRIEILFEQAKETYAENPKLAQRYIIMARKVAMSARIRFPVQFRRQVCKKCSAVLIQGQTCRTRVRQRREPHVVITCLTCGYSTRIPIKQKKGVVLV